MNQIPFLARDFEVPAGKVHTRDYLARIGVPEIEPATCPFDPGYDPLTFEGHLAQSSHLMETMKISMACWQVCNEDITRWKVAACKHYGVPTVTGGGPFEVAVQQGQLPLYLDLVADIGVTGIEAGEGFTDMPLPPKQVMAMANERGLALQFELGKKHEGTFTSDVVGGLIEQGKRWLEAGARQVVIEARESAQGIGCFDESGRLNAATAPIASRTPSDSKPAVRGAHQVRASSRCSTISAARSISATSAWRRSCAWRSTAAGSTPTRSSTTICDRTSARQITAPAHD